MRHAFSKCSGNLGETGSVSSFAFRFAGYIVLEGVLTPALEELLLESGASDYHEEEDGVHVETAWHDFAKVRTFFQERNISLIESG
jgi:transcriptional/translational regulatory protein YebC/TACO1